MWSRTEIKRSARSALSGTYWWCILICLIYNLISSIISTVSGRIQQLIQLIAHIPISLSQIQAGLMMNGMKEYMDALYSALGTKMPSDVFSMFQPYAGVRMAFSYLPLLIPIAVLSGMIVYAFAGAHFQVGFRRFFINAAHRSQKISDLGYAFSSAYLNVAKVMFIQNLIIIAGYCLFIVPGVIFSYRFYFVPFLLAENPKISLSEALRRSTEMTKGNKFKIFLLELSFAGWIFLSMLCICGVGTLFLNPYIQASYTQLYFKLNTPSNEPVYHV